MPEKTEKKEKIKEKKKAYKPAEKFCPKCGVRMASHQNRFACGKCHYTELKK